MANDKSRLDSALIWFTKHILNPIIRHVAYSRFGPFAMVRHVGRRSGKPYETPIIVMRIPDGFAVALTYGPDVDWYRNVVAAGCCTLVWHGKSYEINRLEPVDRETGIQMFPRPFRFILRRRSKTEYVRFLS